MYISHVSTVAYNIYCCVFIAYNIHCSLSTSSYPDGGYRNHMGVAHSYCYELLHPCIHIHGQFSGFTTNVCHAVCPNVHTTLQCRVWKESCNVQVEIFENKCMLGGSPKNKVGTTGSR